MRSVAVVVPHPTQARRHLIAYGRGVLHRAAPTPTGKPCVWCGHTIYKTDFTERIGLAGLHRVPCVEPFDRHTYGPEGTQ